MAAKTRLTFLVILVLLPLGRMGSAQRVSAPTPSEARAIHAFLTNFAGPPDAMIEAQGPTKYLAMTVDLDGSDSRDVVLYLYGRGWCGSGGCRTLILKPDGKRYALVSQITITWPPIRVLRSTTNGWHDLSAVVHGGGIRVPYTAKIPFDGTTYASNPSMPPSSPMARASAGKAIISGADLDQGVLLYPATKR